jgi:hypothetical protein
MAGAVGALRVGGRSGRAGRQGLQLLASSRAGGGLPLRGDHSATTRQSRRDCALSGRQEGHLALNSHRDTPNAPRRVVR